MLKGSWVDYDQGIQLSTHLNICLDAQRNLISCFIKFPKTFNMHTLSFHKVSKLKNQVFHLCNRLKN